MDGCEPALERPSLFISYARADDEPFVQRLHHDLVEVGMEVWWDRKAMESRGRTFLQEIRDGIEGADRVVAVIGPEAAASEYVRYEWEYALLFAKGVVPILRQGDFDLIPETLQPEAGHGLADHALGLSHCQDFRNNDSYDTALEQLVRIIETPLPPLAPIHETPALPPHFVPRRDPIAAVQQTVLADSHRPTAITSAQRTAVLQGMGGIGKSVLAAAFARAVDTRRAFEHGILWLKVGHEATRLDLFNNIKRIGLAFKDDPTRYVDEVSAKARLSTVLADKVCLIILDDVWSLDQAEPFFNALSPRCCLLITTRDGGLAASLGAEECRVDVLTDDQALTLLTEWSDQPGDTLPAEAREVAKECGNLPLAIAMAGAMVRGKPDRWPNVLHRLRTADLDKLKRQFPNYDYPDLLRALQVSVDALEPGERKRYLDLAAFPEATPIPEATLETFWAAEGLDAYDTQDLIDLFVQRSLVRREYGGPITLHDLQMDYVRRQIEDPQALQARLLEAYASRCADGWARGRDDGYFFQFLPYHLKEAGKEGQLREVLLDYDWLLAKLRATDAQALIGDCDLLVEDAEIRLLQGALRLSIPALVRDPGQLATHLVGRLLRSKEAHLQRLCEVAKARGTGGPWLYPRTASLRPAGGLLIQTFIGHKNGILGATILADGRRALSWSGDGTLWLWDLDSGTAVRTLKGNKEGVQGVTILADGRWALSWSQYNQTLRLWDLETGAALRILEGHTDSVRGAVILPNNSQLLSWSGDGTLRIWDLESGTVLHTLKGHKRSTATGLYGVGGVTVFASGRRALSWSGDQTQLRLWDLETGTAVHALKGHKEGVRGVTILADGRRALSWSRDGTMRLWNLELGKTLCILKGHEAEIWNVMVFADDGRALSWSRDGTLRLWDLESGTALHMLEGDRHEVIAGAIVLASGRQALSWSYERTLRLWDLQSGGLLHTFEGHMGPVKGVTILADGRRALSWSEDGTLRLWDLEARTALHILEGHTRWVRGATVFAGGRRVLSWSEDGTLRLWDLEVRKEPHALEGHMQCVRGVTALPDCRRILSWSEDRTLRLWDLEAGTTLDTLRGHTDTVWGAIVLADGQRALSWSRDETLRLWDLEAGTTSLTLKGHRFWVMGATVLSDGQRALSWSLDKTLRLWDLESGTALRALVGHEHGVSGALLLVDDGRALSWANYEKALWLWDLEAGTAVHTLKGHDDGVLGATILAGGLQALSWSNDQTLRLWDLEAGRSLHTLGGHTEGILGATVLADSCQALSWDRDGILRLWDLEAGTPLHTLDGHTDTVWSAIVLADGRRAISASEDWSLILWDLKKGRKIARFIGEAAMGMVLEARNRLFVAGSVNGAVHILELHQG